MCLMNVKTMIRHYKYVSIPVDFGRSKKVIFGLVVDSVWKKIKGWKEKFLSRHGKEVIIKVIAQVISSYIMRCYKLPEGMCQEIEGMLAKFWWRSKNDERRVYWLSWERMDGSKGI